MEHAWYIVYDHLRKVYGLSSYFSFDLKENVYRLYYSDISHDIIIFWYATFHSIFKIINLSTIEYCKVRSFEITGYKHKYRNENEVIRNYVP